MCRMLFAYLPSPDFSREDILEKFLRLAEMGNLPTNVPLSSGHKDGWGVAYYKNCELHGWYRSTNSATNDVHREEKIGEIAADKSTALLAHVRKGTVGEPSEHNSHPFVSGCFSFIHNGTLGHADQAIFDPIRNRATGETDSELYFHLVIGALSVNDEHAPAVIKNEIVRTISALRVGTSHAGGGFTSASSILTDGRFAYALREYDEEHPFVKKYNAHDYHALFLGEGESGERIICSEQLSLDGIKWTLLPNHSLSVIDLASGVVLTEHL